MAHRILKGLGWTSVSSLIRNIVLILQVSILTRILDKNDFGIIAVANLFISFTNIFLDLGLSIGIIHTKRISNKIYSSLFWLNIISGSVLTLILFFLAPIVTASYQSKELTKIVQLLCFTIFLNALGTQQRTVCQKNFLFKRLAIIEIITSIITFAMAFITAKIGFGVFSLAYSTLAGGLFLNLSHLIVGIIKEHRITFHFCIKETYSFLKIGTYAIGSSIMDFLARELDIIIVSSMLGLEFLGVYSIAKKIPVAIYSFINPIMIKVVTPLLAEINNNLSLIKEYFLLITKGISWVSTPIYMIMAALAPTIMQIVFGPEFVEGAIVLAVFAIQYAFNSKSSICGSLQTALARTDIGLYWTFYRIISTALIYYITAAYGIKIFLCGIIVHVFINIFVAWRIQYYNMIKVSLPEYIDSWIRPFGIAGVLATIIAILYFKPSLLYSILAILLFIGIYIVMLLYSRDLKGIFEIMNKLGIKTPDLKPER